MGFLPHSCVPALLRGHSQSKVGRGRSTQTLDWAEEGSPLRKIAACLSPEPTQRTPVMDSSGKVTHITQSPVPIFLPPASACFGVLPGRILQGELKTRAWGTFCVAGTPGKISSHCFRVQPLFPKTAFCFCFPRTLFTEQTGCMAHKDTSQAAHSGPLWSPYHVLPAPLGFQIP